jgi:hypothetical protein
MGRVAKSHSIHVQNSTKSPFSNKDLVWRSEICHGGQNKVTIQFAYVPYVTFWNSWKVNEGIQASMWNGMFTKTFQAKRMSSNQLSKTTLGIHGKHLWHYPFHFFNSYTKDVIIFILKDFWSKYQCRYGPKDYRENSTHIQSIQ